MLALDERPPHPHSPLLSHGTVGRLPFHTVPKLQADGLRDLSEDDCDGRGQIGGGVAGQGVLHLAPLEAILQGSARGGPAQKRGARHGLSCEESFSTPSGTVSAMWLHARVQNITPELGYLLVLEPGND